MTASMTASARECVPWCSHHDNHPADEPCYGPECLVDLSVHPEIRFEHRTPDGRFTDGPDQISVHGYVSQASDSPHVLVAHNGQPELPFFQLELTRCEAEQLIEVLQLVLGQIGGTR